MGRAPLFVSIGYGELVEQELCSVVERLQDISRSSDRSFENVNKVVGADGREGLLAYYPELPHISREFAWISAKRKNSCSVA